MGESQSKLTLASTPPTIIMLFAYRGPARPQPRRNLPGGYNARDGVRFSSRLTYIVRPRLLSYRCWDSRSVSPCGRQIPLPGRLIFVNAVATARSRGHDVAIIDTAGRLHIDEGMMEELRGLRRELVPHEVLFVADIRNRCSADRKPIRKPAGRNEGGIHRCT